MQWDADLDRLLLAAIGRGLSIRASARKLGLSESAAIARHYRIRAVTFPSDVERARAAKEATRARRARRLATEREAMRSLSLLLVKGADRNTAIRVARSGGARLVTIARHFGLTHQRITQIAAGGA